MLRGGKLHFFARQVVLCAVLAVAIAGGCSGQSSAWTWPTMTAAGNTASLSVVALAPSKHTLQVTVAGSPTGCAARLEGSLDGVGWFDLSGSQDCTSGSIMFHVIERPVHYVRAVGITLSGGSSPSLKFRYMGVR